jgi:hypothetical protein
MDETYSAFNSYTAKFSWVTETAYFSVTADIAYRRIEGVCRK